MQTAFATKRRYNTPFTMMTVLITNALWLGFLLFWCLLCYADAKNQSD